MMKLYQALIFALICKLCLCATNVELDAKAFVARASERYFNLINEIVDNVFANEGVEEYDIQYTMLQNVERVAHELMEISEEANEYDLNQIQDPDLKRSLNLLHERVYLFALGDSYFESFMENVKALVHDSVKEKDIDPFMGGTYMPNQDDSQIAFYPDIKKIFGKSSNPEELQYYWETWREKNMDMSRSRSLAIIDDIKTAAKLLERPVLNLYYSGFEVNKLLSEMDHVMEELKPIYQQLHAFIRHELHKKYGSEVIDPNGPIPHHLFEQVVAQDWRAGSVIESYYPFRDLPPVDDFVKKYNSKQIFDKAQDFYKSLGFNDLDKDFLENRLREIEDSENDNECRAVIYDETPKTSMSYCQMVDFRKFLQMHGYIGRLHYADQAKHLPAHYFLAYNLQEPVGEAVLLSASTPKHMQAIGLATNFKFTNNVLMNRLSRMAIHTILDIPVYYVHNKIINELLNETLEEDGINRRYWKLMETYVGVEPPSDRGEMAFDFPIKFYEGLEHNKQTEKFLSEILGYQFYKAFCKKSKHTGPLHNCDFYGNKEVGNDLKSMMSLGSSKSFHEVLSRVLGDKSALSAEPILDYYTPIIDWLKGLNTKNNNKIGWNSSKKIVL